MSELDASDNAIASDSDVLFNAEALYGDKKGILGQASYDHNGDGYDVITSAKLVNWAGHGDKQIYYDGDHTDFTDSGDVLDRNASTYSVATTGVTAEQKGWMSAVDTANNGAATPSFYVEISGKKVAVYLDDTDSNNVVWKVDTTSFGITSDVSINDTNISTIKSNLMDAYGINVTTSALEAASSVYLNATETDIGAFLSLANGGGVALLLAVRPLTLASTRRLWARMPTTMTSWSMLAEPQLHGIHRQLEPQCIRCPGEDGLQHRHR